MKRKGKGKGNEKMDEGDTRMWIAERKGKGPRGQGLKHLIVTQGR